MTQYIMSFLDKEEELVQEIVEAGSDYAAHLKFLDLNSRKYPSIEKILECVKNEGCSISCIKLSQ